MAMMRIKCSYCQGHWEIYERDKWNADDKRICPHCGSKIDIQTWQRHILPAFATFMDANKELVKDCLGHRITRFSVDFIEDNHFPNDEKFDDED